MAGKSKEVEGMAKDKIYNSRAHSNDFYHFLIPNKL
jgi:hypothetical protein